MLLAWLFGTNTVMAVLLQVAAARGVDSVASSLRAARISASFFVLSCFIVLVTHDTLGWVTIALVWLGHVTVTGAELYQSAAHWGFLSELSGPQPARGVPRCRPHRRHRRRGVGARGVHLPRDGVGHPRLADDRGHRGGRDALHGAGLAVGPALPRCRAGAGDCLNRPS